MSMCVCITNYYSSGGVCTKCGDNSVPSADQAKCVCIQGYVLIKNTCVMQVQTCLNGTLNEQTGLCYCTYIGTYFVTSVGCVCRDSFAYFSTLTRMCVCIAGYYYSNGACTKCWDMSTPSNDLSTCLCIQGYVAVGLTCVIQNINCYNGTLNKDTGICYCTAAGTSFVAKVGCLCRDPKSTFDPNSNYCICPANFYISKGLCT